MGCPWHRLSKQANKQHLGSKARTPRARLRSSPLPPKLQLLSTNLNLPREVG